MPIITKPKDIRGLTLPTIQVIAESLPEGYEKALWACRYRGGQIKTQYDKPREPASRDCALVLTIKNPFAEPRIHRCFPGGFEDLEKYRLEVVEGVRDHWVDKKDELKWHYSYHKRLVAYDVPGLQKRVNQLEYIIDTLVKTPHTRRAQAILWQPWEDAGDENPCCLQRIWFRIFNDSLVGYFHIRSNDAYRASFMNMYAFTDLQRYVAKQVSERSGRTIRIGEYNHIADSYHIYGSCFKDFAGHMRQIRTRPWERRTMHTSDVQDIMDEAGSELKSDMGKELVALAKAGKLEDYAYSSKPDLEVARELLERAKAGRIHVI